MCGRGSRNHPRGNRETMLFNGRMLDELLSCHHSELSVSAQTREQSDQRRGWREGGRGPEIVMKVW
jgi:hypothetical protein